MTDHAHAENEPLTAQARLDKLLAVHHLTVRCAVGGVQDTDAGLANLQALRSELPPPFTLSSSEEVSTGIPVLVTQGQVQVSWVFSNSLTIARQQISDVLDAADELGAHVHLRVEGIGHERPRLLRMEGAIEDLSIDLGVLNEMLADHSTTKEGAQEILSQLQDAMDVILLETKTLFAARRRSHPIQTLVMLAARTDRLLSFASSCIIRMFDDVDENHLVN